MPAKHLAAPPLPYLIRQVEAALSVFPASPFQDGTRDRNPAWTAAQAALEKLILSEGGSCRADWQGGVVRLWGLKATSVIGLRGAAQNWLTQARVADSRAKAGSA